ncbi:MAG: heterodisulfide reductase-related iron-sulfur binding cluster [Gammaproteobacteria bacterium]|nr:heterodisulfide reductase-related iron-sulfur binding cluster [Gammaproteobacteria bacterium]MCY4337835.1 heterodisulfide reductase-related iron-sulfur binding cluster [Gammaproteobacteria bacterium]
MSNNLREGSLEAPTRHPIDWKQPDYYDQDSLFAELARVYDICHGCRRCVSLCHAFPTLFDLVDESDTMEVDGVAKEDYGKVVDHCYLCDLCYMTKCPYVPPHEWNVDFPHLMLRAKAVNFSAGKAKWRDRVLTSTKTVGNLAGIPVVAQAVNAANKTRPLRQLLEKTAGIHADAPLPQFHSKSFRSRMKGRQPAPLAVTAAGRTTGKVALFVTCYCNRNTPQVAQDLVAVFEYNGIPVTLAQKEECCGMPKLELGDLNAVARAKDINIPQLIELVEQGCDIVAPIPSCVLMFKQELPLMFPDDVAVEKVRQAFFDPFEYLMLRHRESRLNTDFKQSLGKILYHAPCHQRVQNIGSKTREVLALAPDTEIEVVERCSGHDGTYAVKAESHDIAKKICRPVVNKVKQAQSDHYLSDCPMAGAQIESGMGEAGQRVTESAFALLRTAYGI